MAAPGQALQPDYSIYWWSVHDGPRRKLGRGGLTAGVLLNKVRLTG
jgi:hypothetical protein